MDTARAVELLSALADGIDPFTGELLPEDHVCNQPEMIRAFHEPLNIVPSPKRKKQPCNAASHGQKLRKKNYLTNLILE